MPPDVDDYNAAPELAVEGVLPEGFEPYEWAFFVEGERLALLDEDAA